MRRASAIARPAPRAWLIDAPDFWRLWLVGLVVFAVRWLEMLAVAVFAYQHTGSPFVVAALTMLRMLPMALFGALIGALAERCERRSALILVVVSLALTSLTLALLAFAGELASGSSRWKFSTASPGPPTTRCAAR